MKMTRKSKDSKKAKEFSKPSDIVEELKNQLARALADYDNLRKRVDFEIDERTKVVKARFILRLLSIYDMLVNAQRHLSDPGLAIISEEFKNLLKDEGVEEIKVNPKDEFNQDLFEVVEAVESNDEQEAGRIKEVVLSGWKFSNGTVVRPVKVKVYRQEKSDKK
ncbi:nucleotide exchange factor GrpE [Candidatus Woesebacteria bacterium RBG_16_34_12]|uniref:Protein GrpE n=1 Tax=Candidatus Woesebacteria bacterium RBG_16_34_12 TaxID=1802480 RepID=A0A1F7X9N5_9BACT|nr:MAG: nucleotide exchange factor GrpE [Candidatus Woesebacteria bacterium RBG_16_34_12]